MKKSLFVFCVSVVIGMSNCSDHLDLYKDSSQPVDKRVENLMSQMTLKEKVAQMCQYVGLKHMQNSEKHLSLEELEKNHAQGFYKDLHSSQVAEMVEQGLVGSFLHVTDLEEANYLQTLAQKSKLQIPLLIGIDAIHGNGLCYGVTIYPTAIGQASTFDTLLVKRAAEETAFETRATGSHWAFTPNVDIARDPRWGRTGETYGEDPFLVSAMGVATVQGLQGSRTDKSEHVLACVKHLVGGGQSVNGRNCAPFDASDRMLDEIFFPPFKACVKAGASTVMAAHNELNGIPCHGNKFLLTDILRDKWHFEGFVVSDWMDIERMHGQHRTAETPEEASVISVNAGVDMHMHGPYFMEHILNAVKNGQMSEKRVNDAVCKILKAKFELGLFENPFYDEKKSKEVLFNDKHRMTALQLSRESIVLLTNKGILPLDESRYKNILVAGPNADSHAILGDWGLPQPEENMVTILDGLRKVSSSTTFHFVDMGFNIRKMDAAKIVQAGRMAQQMDAAIIVVGENSMREHWLDKTCGENMDRSDIALPGLQQKLVEEVHRAGIPVIVVLVNGRQLGVEWIVDNASALVEAWEPGSLGGQAVAEVLYGQVNPSGKLPVTVPRHVGQLQCVYNHKSANTWFPYALGNSDPLFHFGYGLSYTKYHYDNLKLEKPAVTPDGSTSVSIDVSNIGDRDGDEIVQLYIRDEYSSATRPVKELKGFRRVHLKKGETQTVTFNITPDLLAYYDAEMNYGVEKGTFTIMLGSSSKDEDLRKIQLIVE